MQVNTVVGKMARLRTEQQTDEVAFFDSKLNVAIGISATMLLGYGQTIEEILLHSVGETAAVTHPPTSGCAQTHQGAA